MQNQIKSFQNDKIKFLNQLKEKSRVRKREKRFIIEGKREITLAIQGGYSISQLYYCSSIITYEEISTLITTFSHQIELFEITLEIYQKLAYRTTTEGVIALMISKDIGIENFTLSSTNPLILVAEAPEKPGNIGALLRTADAAQLDAVFIANPKTDIYNPNIIRSSVGCIFTNKIATGSSENIIDFLKKHNIHIYGAALQKSVDYHTQDYTKPSALVVGTEATGLSNIFLENATQNIKIPMSGVIDSMNVSVAAGILIFEAKRQRGFNG
ncbi:TrmH family RNA methyltransferase [Aquimarina sp. MAR_2010_214]|uniref:TrmH family RNA methyltransferase n=1 Tax=Aquimarina sp. MAR_2010_214 TaxID=1250026 RepID=UPI000C710563|nr:RNA methyltransferase [Aquimarina sp. MAR_2010_214]PKV52182.1 TrmH family RNA methyltransferase [Aquimarina sp. MAR_2010_214]